MITYEIDRITNELVGIQSAMACICVRCPLLDEEIIEFQTADCQYVSIDFLQKLFVNRLISKIKASPNIDDFPLEYAKAYITIINFGMTLIELQGEAMLKRLDANGH